MWCDVLFNISHILHLISIVHKLQIMATGKTVFMLLVLAGFVCGDFWLPCKDPGTGIKFNSVTIPGCTAAPCSFKKGTNQSMSFNFTANQDFDKLTIEVCGEFGTGCLDLNLPDSNLCDLGVICPVKSGDTDVAKLNIYVNPSFPPIKIVVEVRVKDSKGTIQGCFEVEIEIVS